MTVPNGGAAAPSKADRRAAGRDALIASIGVLAVLGGVKHLLMVVPNWAPWLLVLPTAFQLYFPAARVGVNGVDWPSLGLRLDDWRGELRAFAVAAVCTGVPYAAAFHAWRRLGYDQSFSFGLPAGFLEQVVVEVVVIAFSEELFFRGYLQERLETCWSPKLRLFGIRFGAAVVIASAVFAAAHFVGDYRPARLGPFFPGLVFGLLRARRGHLVGAVAFHAFCNLLADVLMASHR